ncbi:hypothetical protein CcI49_35105 [Frankia sp. CcI49]|uniref:hypothetical protein n=1 Tax=unclassified Frankia TaxID=2632575 RepID=UPI0006C9EF6F|nr:MULTISPECIES: hypothetical protein [unclassified Frankia]KPM56135.1 hypothetical protein ACG83_13470 [Frankia sp. R43]ONH51761.1 hypothetical protein CcI49_35105 [Frankia sp. CcI49]
MSLLAWAILVVLLLGAAYAAAVLVDRSRSARLRSRFGPEYERTLQESGDRRRTERRLAGIARRRDRLDVQPLGAPRRAELKTRWTTLQALFVDEPVTATTRADELITTVLRERGYPTDDRAETADLLALDDPALAAGLRRTHHGTAGTGAPGGSAGVGPAGTGTEAMRLRFLALRAVFDGLIAPAEEHSAAGPVGLPRSTDTGKRASAGAPPTGAGTGSGEAGDPAPHTNSSTDGPSARVAALPGRRQRS